jgi:hypothetical protein
VLLLRVINQSPLWMVVVAVVAVAEFYSLGLIIGCRGLWGPVRLKLNNEVAGLKFAVAGVLYAVLLGFVVIAVWDNYQNTETAVRNEAKAVLDLRELSYALSNNAGVGVRESLTQYADSVETNEWATMARGYPSPKTADAFAHLTEAVLALKPLDAKGLALYQDALRLIAVIQDNRSERLDSANGSVPPIIWLVLIAGAMIVLGYPAFFGTPSAGAQMLMTAAVAALVALALLPALLLDYPFTGEVQISSEPFAEALTQVAPHVEGRGPGEQPSPPAPATAVPSPGGD